jgi:hypothetical protein
MIWPLRSADRLQRSPHRLHVAPQSVSATAWRHLCTHPPTTFDYQWEREDPPNTWTTIAGASGQSYQVGHDDDLIDEGWMIESEDRARVAPPLT